MSSILRGLPLKFRLPTGIHWAAGFNHIREDAATTYKIKNILYESRAQQEPVWDRGIDVKGGWQWEAECGAYDNTMFVDRKLTSDQVSRKDFRIYRNFDKELQLGKYALFPMLLGMKLGSLPLLWGMLTNESTGRWGVNLTRQEGESYESALLRRYRDHVDETRLQMGPILNRHFSRLVMFDIRDSIYKTPYDSGAAYHQLRNLFCHQMETSNADVTLVPDIAFWCKKQLASMDMRKHPHQRRANFYRTCMAFADKPWSFASYNMFNLAFSTTQQELIGWQTYNFINDLLQDDAFIVRDGGTSVMSDEELLLSCCERGIARAGQGLSRVELKKRLDDWLYLSERNLPAFAYIMWASTFHWEGSLYNDSDPWKDINREELETAFPEIALAPKALPEMGSLNSIVERGSIVPEDVPDSDPFLGMQPSFAFSSDLERDCFNSFRENWLRSDDPQYRIDAFVALADLIADAAPAYLAEASPEVQKATIAAATHNLLMRGPNTREAIKNADTAAQDIAGISGAAAAVLSGDALTNAASKAGQVTWTLPATAVHELRVFINAKDLYPHPDNYTPRGRDAHAERFLVGTNGAATSYQQPWLWSGQRSGERAGSYVLEPSFVSPRVADFETTQIDAPVKRGDPFWPYNNPTDLAEGGPLAP
eukprot:TRINITY_DN67604_c11_g11_i1.p1 TRINITY_DN67604_c11_g11~~TRINITY_DN67604_c11_g11_i1.p1  ORF type:complete len:664 (-),score=82.80 TRINITY_DN67604_c11_g11_i1:236-2194(-)